ncbi:MAG: hypothetical protein ABSB35_01565 [Bryobacteraceae bacterium]
MRVVAPCRGLNALEVSELLSPPETEVKLGSVNFAFGGGPLLVAGIGFIVAAHEAFPAGRGADFAFYGGAIMAVLGIIDLAVNWERMITEIPKIQSETALNEVKIRLTELEIRKAER